MSALQVPCPNCGPRAASEFSFGGEFIAYPQHADETLDENYARVWLRENRHGRHHEQWFHHAGCRRWFTTTRDTANNAIASHGLTNDGRTQEGRSGDR